MYVSLILIQDTSLKMYLDTKYKILFKYLRYVSRHLYLRYSPALGNVATQLRCGGIFTDSVITDFLLILIVKEF